MFETLERECLEKIKEKDMLAQQQMYDEEVESGKIARIHTSEPS